jgi:holo-[acyl-carrier protein] synthase
MIIGTGNDIVEIARIDALLNDAFIARIFTAHEQAYCNKKANRSAAYAKRFAAKEAMAKALGCGIGADASFSEIEVINNERGAPHIQLHGSALARLHSLLPRGHMPHIFLALTDEKSYAMAHVIIESRN